MTDETAAAASGKPAEAPEGAGSAMDRGKGAADPHNDVEMDEDDDDEDEDDEEAEQVSSNFYLSVVFNIIVIHSLLLLQI